jgi:hypothetical protein
MAHTSSVALTIIDLLAFWDLPDEVTDKILRLVFKIPLPTINQRGNIVSSVKNIWRCPRELVLDTIEQFTFPGIRPKWYQEIILPKKQTGIYNRQVCIWKPEYYDIPIRRKGIEILKSWVNIESDGLVIKQDIDWTDDEWIGFRTWLGTHPIYQYSCFVTRSFGIIWCRNKRYSRLTRHWNKYELAKAYPTLYGKDGWANKLEKEPEQY